MTEALEKGKLLDTLSKVSSLDDVEAALPKSLTGKLGEGNEGVKRTIGMLISLAVFAPEVSFSREAFDDIVAYDYEADQLLPPEEAQRMIDVGLESGFLQRADTPAERYIFHPQVHRNIERLAKEAEK